jgi:hypothetical protein
MVLILGFVDLKKRFKSFYRRGAEDAEEALATDAPDFAYAYSVSLR